MYKFLEESFKLEGLDEFMYKPDDICSNDERQHGINTLSFFLTKNPEAVFAIFNNHPQMAAIYVFEELAEKLKHQQRLDLLNLFYDKFLNKLIEVVYNFYDLNRLIDIMPSCATKILENSLSDTSCMNRIYGNDPTSKEKIDELGKKYPSFKDQLLESYNQHIFNGSGGPQ